MNGEALSAALRAQASGLAAGSLEARAPYPAQPGRAPSRSETTLPAWALLGLAVALGGMAGGLAGVISTW